MPTSSKAYVSSSSSISQVVTPVRSGQGYVYEFPSKYQKDTYDIPPVRPLQGVSTNKAHWKGTKDDYFLPEVYEQSYLWEKTSFN